MLEIIENILQLVTLGSPACVWSLPRCSPRPVLANHDRRLSCLEPDKSRRPALAAQLSLWLTARACTCG